MKIRILALIVAITLAIPTAIFAEQMTLLAGMIHERRPGLFPVTVDEVQHSGRQAYLPEHIDE